MGKRKSLTERRRDLMAAADWLGALEDTKALAEHVKRKERVGALECAREIVDRLETMATAAPDAESDAGEQLAAQTLADDSKGRK